MQNVTSPVGNEPQTSGNEEYIRYLMRATKVSRQEVLDTIARAGVTARQLVECLKSKVCKTHNR